MNGPMTVSILGPVETGITGKTHSDGNGGGLSKELLSASEVCDNMGGDVVTVLVSRKKKLAKTWNADGTIEAYDDALWFKSEEHEVGSIQQLGLLLKSIESDPYR